MLLCRQPEIYSQKVYLVIKPFICQSTTLFQTEISKQLLYGLTFYTHTNVPRMIQPTDFGDPPFFL